MEPETNPEEEVIAEETPEEEVEEVVDEEPVVEEETVEEPAVPVLVTLPFSITNTRENLIVIAKDRGYQDTILRDDYTEDMPLEQRFIPNPVDPIDWLNDYIKDFLADVASKPFIEARKREAQAQIQAEADVVKQIARQSIS